MNDEQEHWKKVLAEASRDPALQEQQPLEGPLEISNVDYAQLDRLRRRGKVNIPLGGWSVQAANAIAQAALTANEVNAALADVRSQIQLAIAHEDATQRYGKEIADRAMALVRTSGRTYDSALAIVIESDRLYNGFVKPTLDDWVKTWRKIDAYVKAMQQPKHSRKQKRNSAQQRQQRRHTQATRRQKRKR